METAALKSFATWARTELIREVSARIAVVLAPGSPERVEQPNTVAALEKAVGAAGGGAGRAAVADKVAYMWFNRVIALRFMDANGYTGIGVVSPERDGRGGQPEILAAAKRGNIDGTVVTNKRTVDTVTGLLNGTRRSDDPQGEAYAVLLVEYCRFWNRSMPFMFEHEGDYTELLIPGNLLADDSILARAVAVLTEDVCRDVEVIGWLYQFYISDRKDEVFAGFKKNKKAGAAEIPAATQLFTPHWIVRYLVENSLGRLWMLNRPTSRLVEQMDYYIAPVDLETDFLKIGSPEELKVIDPASGSGHMLTYAFDLLYSIYEEEGYAPSDIPGLILSHNLYGIEIDPRAGALAAFALTMKARACQRTFFNKQVEPNICVLEPITFTPSELDQLRTPTGNRTDEAAFWNQFSNADTFGSLIRPRDELIEPLKRHLDTRQPDTGDIIGDELHKRASKVLHNAGYLRSRYDIAVANPPYMGAKNMDSRLTEFAKHAFVSSKSDLYAMFIERCLQLVEPAGLVGMVTMHTWMFIASFERLRMQVLRLAGVRHLAHLGTGAFGSIGGEVVSTAAFVLSSESKPLAKGMYLRLVGEKGENAKREAMVAAAQGSGSGKLLHVRSQEVFFDIPGAPFAYWLSDAYYRAFSDNPSLGDIATPRTGMRTGDNDRFLRLWHEVSSSGFSLPSSGQQPSKKWVVYAKGGPSRRWFGNVETVVNWADNGHEIKEETLRNYPQLSWDNLGWKISNEAHFFTRGITWTDMSTSAFGARLLPPGCIFDAAGPSLFGSDSDALLALLNSNVVFSFLTLLNPTLHFKNYNIAAIPLPSWDVIKGDLKSAAMRAVILAERDWSELETAWGFSRNPLIWRGESSASMFGAEIRSVRIRQQVEGLLADHANRAEELRALEIALNRLVIHTYGIEGLAPNVERDRLTLNFNPDVGDARTPPSIEANESLVRAYAEEFISFAVGCMLGRYSLDEPGLILANQGDTLQNFLAKVPTPSFEPDQDNVIPIVDGDWFEDDIVARFRKFLRVAFGETHFEENLRFVTEALGVNDIRDYFVKSFYKDHVQRYKKRPIYWLFSSPKGSFNALIYMHRYTPSTVSIVLSEYLREFNAKLVASRQHHERLAAGSGRPREQAASQKEVDRLRKVLLELDEYEHDVMYPLATQHIQIDLDDGVKANYPKLGAALKQIPGLEANDE